MLKGLKKADIQRGQVLSKPGNVSCFSEFQSDLYVLKTEEGGRKKPFFTNYRWVFQDKFSPHSHHLRPCPGGVTGGFTHNKLSHYATVQ